MLMGLKMLKGGDLMTDTVPILRDPATIRDRAHQMLSLCQNNALDHFTVDMDKLADIALFVAKVIRKNYPDLKIPYHSRWRHFEHGGIDRWGMVSSQFSDAEKARRAIDLAVSSVLLDAGAGPDWQYKEKETGIKVGRSEGLGIASFHMFCDGLFSSTPDNPYHADAEALAALDTDDLAAAFQVSDANPMTGLAGRVDLLRKLAEALSLAEMTRPGDLFDRVTEGRNTVKAKEILGAILQHFSSIWPGRIEKDGQNLGDVWPHSKINGLVPFHKLSQWLTYSLLEPFEWGGVAVTDLDDLTGLAEYRNGGLFVDGGMLCLKDQTALEQKHAPGDEIIVEWRALTVALLDELRIPVAAQLNIDPAAFPLAKMLEGGSWAAGRKLAYERDPTGEPPLRIISDGTVF